MTAKELQLMNEAMEILELVGVKEECGIEGFTKSYSDPWGAGLDICYGENYLLGKKILAISKRDENSVRGFRPLMVVDMSKKPFLVEYDEMTMWDFFLELCLKEAKNR